MENTIDYADYEKMIYNLAHRFNRTTGIELDELIALGNMKFVDCQKNYDPMLAAYSTYLTIQIKGMFLEMSRKRNNYPIHIPDVEIANKPIAEEMLFFKEILRELSDDAKVVIDIVFNTPRELVAMVLDLDQPRGLNKSQISKFLRKQGWPFCKIDETFKEISAIF